MKFLTNVEVQPPDTLIDSAHSGLVIGSCFADMVGGRLCRLGFDVEVNPYGVLYNAFSVLGALSALKNSAHYTEKDLVHHGGLWHSFAHHGSFSSSNKQQVLSRINSISIAAPKFLIITLGTSWVYEYEGRVVANCHKMPASIFNRRRLTVEQTAGALNQMAELFPDTLKILTVSPIRHIKDGLDENSLSKAIIRAAIGEIVDQRKDCYYFPSFEIMIDELRDYRFYAPDMMHPSEQAVDYIWQRFAEKCLNQNTQKYIEEFQKILRAVNHKPLHPDTVEYQKFKQSTLNQIKTFAKRYPTVDLSDILAKFV